MERTIMVSNRVATADQAAQAGGVAFALTEVRRHYPGPWIGWSGTITDTTDDLVLTDQGDSIFTTPLLAEEHKNYYLGYANSVLWPTFHNRLDLALFEAEFFPAYVAVNRRMAELVKSVLHPGDTIWVHDYHLLLLGEFLRDLGVDNPIGFFLHIPFPPTQAFLAIPKHRRLARALAAYDLVGLQTRADVGRLIDTLQDSVAAQIVPMDGMVRVGDRAVAVLSFPIGIDAFFAGDAAQSEVAPTERLRLVGVDRLDYTKGLPQKFRAFGRYLEMNEDYHTRVVLTQIAAPSRESVEAYSDIRSELEALCGAINGRYGRLDWNPINYINHTTPRAELPSLYRSSRVGLVTPLADGMNLVAKEYLIAQDPADPGVLVLSRFAGAAEELAEAIIVNPYDLDDIAEGIRIALEMPLEQRKERHAALLARLDGNDTRAWASSFLRALRRARRRALPPAWTHLARSLSPPG